MSVSKIKSIVIVALLLINVFFLTVIVVDTIADARSERLVIENACAILRLGGIAVEPDSIRSIDALRTMRAVRDHEAEETIARAVLGAVVMTDLGVIFRYENPDNGVADFYSAGDFEIQINEGVATNAWGTLRSVQRILSDMKLDTSEIVLSGEPGSEVVTAVAAYRGASIFNCAIEFVFSGVNLETVKGRYVTGIEAAEDGAVISSPSAALFDFLAAVRRGEAESTRIYSVESGYQFHHAGGSLGESLIMPAWLITADTGRYIIDSATGDIEPQ